jgi:hypothetical protein
MGRHADLQCIELLVKGLITNITKNTCVIKIKNSAWQKRSPEPWIA